MKNGIVIETNAEYHGDKSAISKSRLANMSVCPQYFKWCEDNPREPTEDLVLGSALHKYVLEKDTFGSEFVVMPLIDRRTKEGKERFNTFLDCAKGREIITQEQFEIISSMSNSVMSNKYSKRLLKGEHENSMYFQDDLTQEWCKVRPDCWSRIGDRVVIVDLKSCKSSNTEDFMRDVIKYHYDLQAYMYSYGVSKVLGVPIENIDFVFIAVEKKEPYLVNILQADTFIMQRGETLFRKYIGQYHECKESGEWYGYNGKFGLINNLTLPNYLLKEINKGE